MTTNRKLLPLPAFLPAPLPDPSPNWNARAAARMVYASFSFCPPD
jgi:hypothetical protein